MYSYFAYIRVSTTKQGERGSSLQEQKSAIEAYAQLHGLLITAWFEEMETAALQGRREFARMLHELQRGTAQGLIIHKIDRSARNLRDWASLGDLIDQGIDVQFVHDGLDLRSRGGRLSADIQAVVAADYIRNLRDEVRKGFYGRLKQGLYPLPAPVGYLDRGGGQPKELDPTFAPLVRHAFERYATGTCSLKVLSKELYRLGLRTRSGTPVRAWNLSGILRNSFYMGLIHIRRTGETFQGVHAPLISQSVFERVQAVIDGKTATRIAKHEFLFRRLIRCKHCGCVLTGERQKQRFVYYRCHGDDCRGTSVAEAAIDSAFREAFRLLACGDDEIRDMRDLLEHMNGDAVIDLERQQRELRLRIAKCDDRLHRLTDALIDGLIDKELFESRKVSILSEKRGYLDALEAAPSPTYSVEHARELFELQIAAYVRYESASVVLKRAIIDQMTSNLSVAGKNPTITLKSPFQEVVNWRLSQNCGPRQGALRTRVRKLLEIITSVAANDTEYELKRAA